MAAKRALVVDDSKSARAFLSRLLEKHHLDVDTAESAEDAIEYLSRHRPDVIFMDHLMPGMDGFQAVQAIKNNPRTATIPILMYTSQEGELYLGQARALGAVGVLPKQIRPADVATVLYQLHLAEDRRRATGDGSYEGEERRQSPLLFERAAATEAPAAVTPEVSEDTAEFDMSPPAMPRYVPPVSQHENLSLRDELGEVRRLIVTGLDQQTERLVEDLRQIVREAQQAVAPARERPARGTFYGIAATLVAVVLGVLWWQAESDRRQLQQQLDELSHARTPAAGAESPVADAGDVNAAGAGVPAVGEESRKARASAAVASPSVFTVPYGELALAGARVDRVRSLLNQLADSGFQGVVDVQAFPGRFCLAGNASDGFSLAADTAPVAQCELIGNPTDEAPGAAQHESLPFANMVAEFHKAHREAIDLRLSTGPAEQVLRPYPEAGAGGRAVTAGEWNAAASANSRVEVRWRARS